LRKFYSGESQTFASNKQQCVCEVTAERILMWLKISKFHQIISAHVRKGRCVNLDYVENQLVTSDKHLDLREMSAELSQVLGISCMFISSNKSSYAII